MLLENIVVSVTKTDTGLLRFVDKKSGRTLCEYIYNGKKDNFLPKISNARALRGDLDDEGLLIVKREYENSSIVCILCVPKATDHSSFEYALVEPLLNQVYLLFLALNAKKFHNL